MSKNTFFTLFVFICLLETTNAQETHDVKRGETLYGVSEKFGVSISDLVKANPSSKRGLRKGMSLVIPILHESIDTVVYQIYKVRPLESFYSIKNKFGVGQEELLDFNPELANGFRSGTFIKIPQFIELDVTEEQDSLSTVELEDLKKIKNKKFKKKDVYNIAFMLPLYLDKNDTIDTFNEIQEDVNIYKKSIYGLDFYSGAKIAIDSLHKAGMNVNIHVYDTKNDIQETFDLVSREEFNQMDLVIGPFYSKNFKIASEILSRRNIPTISPLSTKGNLLENIPNAFQVIPSLKKQITYLSDFIAKNYSDKNITLVRRNNQDEQKYAQWMTSSLNQDSLNYFKEIVVDKPVIDSIHHELDSMAETNIFLIPSVEKDFVTDILTKLNATRDSNFIVFGMPEWFTFKDLDLDYLMDLNVHLPNTGFISYDDSLTDYFVKKYQESTSSDPSQRFAFSGFDISYYFLSILYDKGGISPDMDMKPAEMLHLNFDFNYNRNRKNGSRNQFVQIITYKDLEIVRIKNE